MERAPQYLVALYLLDAEESRVRTGRLADFLEKSPAAATEMVERLAAANLVDHEPYAGVELTPEGASRAAERYEAYAVLVRFCREILGVDDPESEALSLVNVVSRDVTDRLETVLLGPSDEGSAVAAASE